MEDNVKEANGNNDLIEEDLFGSENTAPNTLIQPGVAVSASAIKRILASLED